MRRDLMDEAKRELDKAIKTKGGLADRRTVSSAVELYRKLGDTEKALSILDRSRAFGAIDDLEADFGNYFGRVNFVAQSQTEDSIRVIITTKNPPVTLERRELFQKVANEMGGTRSISLPLERFMPVGTYRANGVPFEIHPGGQATTVTVPLYRVVIASDRDSRRLASFAHSFHTSLGGRLEVINVTSNEPGDGWARAVAWGPHLIVAVGRKVVTTIREHIPKTPMVYIKLPGLDSAGLVGPGIPVAGVEVTPPPDEVLGLLRKALPDANNIAIISCSEAAASMVKAARPSAAQLNFTFIERHIQDPDHLAKSLVELSRVKIDAVWLVPDETLWNTPNLNRILKWARHYRMPVLAHDESLLENGVLFSVYVSDVHIAQGAGMLGRKILWDKEDPYQVGTGYPHGINWVLNVGVAKSYRIDLPDDLINGASRLVDESNL